MREAERMEQPGLSLADLLKPLTIEEFAAHYWDRRVAALPGPADRFRAFYSIEQVESRITETDIRFPQFQLARGGSTLPPETFTRRASLGSHVMHDMVDVAAVYRLWKSGATIILQALQSNAPTLVPLLQRWERDLGHPMMANAYLTPARSQGFSIHYDTHDVFILQVEGRKHWRIWAQRAEPKPLKDEHSEPGVRPEGPFAFDDVLEEGGVLYLPRGYYHEARSLAGPSLHVSVGIPVYRRLDALRNVLREVISDIERSGADVWRTALAPRFDLEPDPAFDALLEEVQRRVASRWSVAPTAERFGKERRVTNLRHFKR